MKTKNLEKYLLCLVTFAGLVAWQISYFLEHQSSVDFDYSRLQPKSKRVSNSPINPTFVLHIGPPKTATTTIQCGLHHLSEQLANYDHIYFMGKTCPQLPEMSNNEIAIAGHHLLMGLNSGNSETRGYQALKSRMHYHYHYGNHMVYSNEGFANHMEDKNVTWKVLQDLFVGWNVRIVIGYRHYFEWIRSLYYQQYLNAKKYKLNWPNQGKGQEHPSFLWYLDYHLKCYETGNLSVDGGHHAPAFGHHLSLSTYKKFAPYFDDIQFFNLYEHGDIVTNFVCKVMPAAYHTCKGLKAQASKKEEVDVQGLLRRVSKSFDTYRIAEAAYARGIIDPNIPKPDVIEQIEAKVKEEKLESNEYFLACPIPTLEARFLNASIAFEKEMLFISHGDQATTKVLNKASSEHRKQFEAAKAEFRFCEVDPNLVLKDADWLAFLTQVGNQER